MKRTLLVLSLFVTAAFQLSAASITVRTGVDATNALLADGAADIDWLITTDGGASFAAPVVAFPAQICCGMETVAGTAKWITDPSVTSDSAATGWGVGNPVTVFTTFDLTGFDLATTSLTGIARVADNTLSIAINGIVIPGSAAGSSWDEDWPVAAGPAFFVPGVNVLSITGDSLNSAWDAFWFDATIADRPTTGEVPEPSSLMLLGAGLGLLGLGARRFRS